MIVPRSKQGATCGVQSNGDRKSEKRVKITKEGEAWLDTENISSVGKYLEGLTILNNSTIVVATIGNCGNPGDILEDLRLTPYDSWSEIEQYEN